MCSVNRKGKWSYSAYFRKPTSSVVRLLSYVLVKGDDNFLEQINLSYVLTFQSSNTILLSKAIKQIKLFFPELQFCCLELEPILANPFHETAISDRNEILTFGKFNNLSRFLHRDGNLNQTRCKTAEQRERETFKRRLSF